MLHDIKSRNLKHSNDDNGINEYRMKYNQVKIIIFLLLTVSSTFSIGFYSKSLLIGKCNILDRILLPSSSSVRLSSTSNIETDSGDNDEEDEEEDDEDEDDNSNKIFPSSGIHLGVEYHNLNPSLFHLEKLSNSLVQVIHKSTMTILSYHCSNHQKGSVTCFGILENKSHIFIHAYTYGQGKGTIAVDILSCDETQLILIDVLLPFMQKEFSKYDTKTPNDAVDKLKNIRWKAFLRNAPYDAGTVRHFCWEDLCGEYLDKKHTLKHEVVSVETPFQRIDVWDIVNPKFLPFESYFLSLSSDKLSYESLNPEYYLPQRVIFLDGVSQSLSKGVEAYHEALVQPAMFAHANPRRVAIIGGGEGATLREALKHKSVRNVTMIDIDEIMCKVSADVLYPLWNSCDDFIYNGDSNITISSCFDDPRAHVRYEDALAWFIQRFSTEQGHEKFDVVIMDALDPQDTVEFANILYQDLTFWKSVYNAITDDGVLVAQLGNSPYGDDGPDNSNKNIRRAALIDVLQHVGFKTTHSYIESHGNFEDPWTFLIICKSHKCNDNWYANPAQVELAIQKRIFPTKSSDPLLKHFDGATMAQYRVPHKGLEAVYCRNIPTPIECTIADHYTMNQKHNEEEGIYTFDSIIQNDISNDEVALVVDMGTSIPMSILSLVFAYNESKDDMERILQGGKASMYNQLLPMIAKLTGPSSVERVGYYLKSCPGSLLSPDNNDNNCMHHSHSQGKNNSVRSNSSSSGSSLFYSPLLDRHIPLFGHLGNYKRG